MLQFLRTTYVLILICLLTVATAIAADNDARVLSVSPSVTSKYQGKSETLAPRMRIPVSATVVSDASGRAQLMFPDTTTVSIAPGTEIALAEFVDNPNEESIVLNMAQGTARFITGDVSRRKPSAMVVNTPQASIGIRGTMVTIVVSGDTTKVYLTETSGLGVTVTNRHTGKTMKMVKPGRMITVTPRDMEDREGKLEEVRKMTIDLHTRPALASDIRKRPEEWANVAPGGMHGPGGVMDASTPALDSPRAPQVATVRLPESLAPQLPPVAPPSITPTPGTTTPPSPSPDITPTTPDLSQYAGTFSSPDFLRFEVNTRGDISNATAYVRDAPNGGFTGVDGTGNVNQGGGININYNNEIGSNNPFNSMTTNGGFDPGSFNEGAFINTATTQDGSSYSQEGRFERQK